jgi:hypothetical protein
MRFFARSYSCGLSSSTVSTERHMLSVQQIQSGWLQLSCYTTANSNQYYDCNWILRGSLIFPSADGYRLFFSELGESQVGPISSMIAPFTCAAAHNCTEHHRQHRVLFARFTFSRVSFNRSESSFNLLHGLFPNVARRRPVFPALLKCSRGADNWKARGLATISA